MAATLSRSRGEATALLLLRCAPIVRPDLPNIYRLATRGYATPAAAASGDRQRRYDSRRLAINDRTSNSARAFLNRVFQTVDFTTSIRETSGKSRRVFLILIKVYRLCAHGYAFGCSRFPHRSRTSIVGEFRIGGGKVDEGYYDTGEEKRQRSDWPPR